jgi:hypothetical protein
MVRDAIARKWRAVAPLDLLHVHQAQPRLVHQPRGVERVAVALAVQLRARQAAQLVVDHRQRLVDDLTVALAPAAEELGELGG